MRNRWHRLDPLLNDWAHFGSISRYPEFLLDDQDRVYLSGTVTGGGPSHGVLPRSTIGYLPEGFRPLYATHVSVASSSPTGEDEESVPAILIVRPDGEVIAKNYNPGWLSMDGMMFFTTEHE